MVSPFTPGPVVQQIDTIQWLADFGVILLMLASAWSWLLWACAESGRQSAGRPPQDVAPGCGVAAGRVENWDGR